MATTSIDTPDVRYLIYFNPMNAIVELTINTAHPISEYVYDVLIINYFESYFQNAKVLIRVNFSFPLSGDCPPCRSVY